MGDEHARVLTLSGEMTPTGHDRLRLGDDHVAGAMIGSLPIPLSGIAVSLATTRA